MTRARLLSIGLALAITPVLFYLGVLAYFYVIQDDLVYPVSRQQQHDLDAMAAELGVRRVTIRSDDGTELLGWLSGEEHDRLLIFSVGRAENVANTHDPHRRLTQQGWAVLTYSWRGFAGSEGSPSGAGFKSDIEGVWTYATEELGYPDDRIVLHGISLGGMISLWMSTHHQPAGVVVDSAGTSLPEVLGRYVPFVPLSLVLHESFDTLRMAPAVQSPVLIVHSVDDELIPVDGARRLAETLDDVRYLEVEGFIHEQLPSYRDPEVHAELVGWLGEQVPPTPAPPPVEDDG